MSESKGSGGLVSILILALSGSLGINYFQYRNSEAKPVASAVRQDAEARYLRSAAEAFGLKPETGRLACDIATDLKLLAGTSRDVSRAQLSDKTVASVCEVLSKEDAATLRKMQTLWGDVAGKRIVVLESEGD